MTAAGGPVETIHEDELPPPDDPEVEARLEAWNANLRAEQRPSQALATGALGLVVGTVSWAELNRWLGFDMPWLLMAGLAVGFGVALGFPFRRAGRLVERRWALVAGALALAMAAVGDFLGVAHLLADRRGETLLTVLGAVDGAYMAEYFASRQPIDWLVGGLAVAGAAVAARPSVTDAHRREAIRVQIHEEQLAEDELEDGELEPNQS